MSGTLQPFAQPAALSGAAPLGVGNQLGLPPNVLALLLQKLLPASAAASGGQGGSGAEASSQGGAASGGPGSGSNLPAGSIGNDPGFANPGNPGFGASFSSTLANIGTGIGAMSPVPGGALAGRLIGTLIDYAMNNTGTGGSYGPGNPAQPSSGPVDQPSAASAADVPSGSYG